MNHKTTLLTIHIFKLTDTSCGFEPENRSVIFSTPSIVLQESSLKNYTQTQNMCDPWMPLRFYDEKITFYELKWQNKEKLQELNTQNGIPRRLLKHNYQQMSPLQLAQLYEQQSQDYNTFIQSLNPENIQDPDKDYFQYIGADFINYQQRRQIEAEDPYLYISCTLSEVNGCDHYYRDAFPICKQCNKVYACRFCHDDEIVDHKLDIKQITDMQCLFCNEIGPIGTHCSKCQKQVSKKCCEVCHVLSQLPVSVAPFHHCDKCGICIDGPKDYSKHCDKCNNCYNTRYQKDHECVIACICPVCQQDLSESIFPEHYLRCDPKHRIHEVCYDALLRNGIFVCPIDHKIIIDDDQYAIIRSKVYHLYQSFEIPYNGLKQLLTLKKSYCYDCNKYSYDFQIPNIPQICHHCFGINTQDISEILCQVIQFIGDIEGTIEQFNALQDKIRRDTDDIDMTIEYVRRFRTINKQLVPKIVRNQQVLILKNCICSQYDNCMVNDGVQMK
ncbi:CHY_zinc finger domain-containing protein [Hexamita inflata]|uniref:CHY zinc finger domain-containing protein n=1 Tax=Hexamita inflata TaxID=28002 RepID=A0AA86PST0_9EUKA|nr:CHY zinc finger domain-containing protein [Hexamita inflata]